MRWLADLQSAFSAKIIGAAIFAWILGCSNFYLIFIRPHIKTAEKINREFAMLEENYFQLQTSHLDSVVALLQNEIDAWEHHKKKYANQALRLEQVPLFLSKLERTAKAFGLTPLDQVRDMRAFAKNDAGKRSITLMVEGSYRKILNYLQNLKTWDRTILLQGFALKKSSGKNSQLTGTLNIFLPIESDLEAENASE